MYSVLCNFKHIFHVLTTNTLYMSFCCNSLESVSKKAMHMQVMHV